jgi:hypothetical protein
VKPRTYKPVDPQWLEDQELNYRRPPKPPGQSFKSVRQSTMEKSMPTNKGTKPLEPRFVSLEEWEQFGLPRETLVISPGFAKSSRQPLKPRLLNPEDLDKLGLPRETLVISLGFARSSGKPPASSSPTSATGPEPPEQGSKNT